jgi:hypothetical protein
VSTYEQLSPMQRLVLDAFGGEAAVAVRPTLVRALRGNGNAAIFLAQSLYWQRRTQRRDGFWYNTQVELEEQTGLGGDAQKTARALLVDLGLLEEQRRDRNALYYRLNLPVLIDLLSVQREKDGLKYHSASVSGHAPELESGHARKLESGHGRNLVSGANSTGEDRSQSEKNPPPPPGNFSLYKIPSKTPSLSEEGVPPDLATPPVQRESGKKIEEKSPEEYIQEQPELEALWVQWVEIMEFTPKSKIREPQAQAFLGFKSTSALSRALADTRQNFDSLTLPFRYLTTRYDEQVKLEPTPLKGSGAAGGGAAAELDVSEGQRWVSRDPRQDRVFMVDALIRSGSGRVVQAESYKDGMLSITDLMRDYRLAE